MKKVLLGFVFSLFSLSLLAQIELSGTWNTGDQNTIVEIKQQHGINNGKIVSSNNKKAKPGMLILKDVKLKKGKWEGQIYAPKRGEWYDAELSLSEGKLEIIISAGLLRRTVEWIKVAS